MAGRRTPPPMGLSPGSANPGAGGRRRDPRPGWQRRVDPGVAAPLAKVRCVQRIGGRGGSAGPCGAVPLCSARAQAAALPPSGRPPARGCGMSQRPLGPRAAPAPARWLRGAARQGAHMDAAPRPGSGRAALHFCSHSSSFSSPPLPTLLSERAGGEGKSSHRKKQKASKQIKKKEEKIKLKKKTTKHTSPLVSSQLGVCFRTGF